MASFVARWLLVSILPCVLLACKGREEPSTPVTPQPAAPTPAPAGPSPAPGEAPPPSPAKDMSASEGLPMPDDASFAMVTISIDGQASDAARKERLASFEKNLQKEVGGSLELNRIRCVHCESPTPVPELTYIYIREQAINTERFNRALDATWKEFPKPFLGMSIKRGPKTGPDCLQMSCGAGCTCISYSICPSSCRKRGGPCCT